MTGRTVLVTGGTGGIGLATAAGLVGFGARVGIVGRDPVRTEAAAKQLRDSGGQVDAFVADLSAQDQVRWLADQVLAAYPRLDVLVNNVGGYWATRHTTTDGLERTFAVNHLAPFLLTNLLLDGLDAAAAATACHPPVHEEPRTRGATSIHLASSAEVADVTGRYFANSKTKASSKASQDAAAAARLWDVSAHLVGLRDAPTSHA